MLVMLSYLQNKLFLIEMAREGGIKFACIVFFFWLVGCIYDHLIPIHRNIPLEPNINHSLAAIVRACRVYLTITMQLLEHNNFYLSFLSTLLTDHSLHRNYQDHRHHYNFLRVSDQNKASCQTPFQKPPPPLLDQASTKAPLIIIFSVP